MRCRHPGALALSTEGLEGCQVLGDQRIYQTGAVVNIQAGGGEKFKEIMKQGNRTEVKKLAQCDMETHPRT